MIGIKEARIYDVNIFIMLYLSSSFVGISANGTIVLSLIILLAITNIIQNKESRVIKSNLFLLFNILILSTLITILINKEGIYEYIIFYTNLTVAFIMANWMNVNKFIKSFTRVLYFLASFSLVIFTIQLTFPSLLELFPEFINLSGVRVNNLVFAVSNYSTYLNRNFGMFWEPGAYQTFLNLALYFELFANRQNPKKVIVLIIAIITTFSTTGYLALILQILIFLLCQINFDSYNFKKIFKVALIFMGIFSAIYFLPDYIKSRVFGKLGGFFANNKQFDTTSLDARTNSIDIAIKSFFKNPIIGIGFNGMSKLAQQSQTNLLTMTPLNWFGLFGIFIGLVFNFPIYLWSKVIDNRIYLRLLGALFLILILSTENYNRNLFLICFLLLGYKEKFYKEKG